MEERIYIIIFPSGDKTKLSTTYLTSCTYYEKNDYAVASRHEFTDEDEAINYCKQLAKENNLIYDGDDDGFLD